MNKEDLLSTLVTYKLKGDLDIDYDEMIDISNEKLNIMLNKKYRNKMIDSLVNYKQIGLLDITYENIFTMTNDQLVKKYNEIQEKYPHGKCAYCVQPATNYGSTDQCCKMTRRWVCRKCANSCGCSRCHGGYNDWSD